MTDANLVRWIFYWFSFLTVLVIALMLMVPKAFAISYDFNAPLPDLGNVTGSFSYDETAGAIATNVRGLSPNSVYPIESSLFTITPGFTGLPRVQATISEFCFGNCVFASGPTTNLIIRGTNAKLQLTWDGIGFQTFSNGWLDLFRPDGTQAVAMSLTSGSLRQTEGSAAVPEGDGFWGLVMGLAGIIAYLRWPR